MPFPVIISIPLKCFLKKKKKKKKKKKEMKKKKEKEKEKEKKKKSLASSNLIGFSFFSIFFYFEDEVKEHKQIVEAQMGDLKGL